MRADLPVHYKGVLCFMAVQSTTTCPINHQSLSILTICKYFQKMNENAGQRQGEHYIETYFVYAQQVTNSQQSVLEVLLFFCYLKKTTILLKHSLLRLPSRDCVLRQKPNSLNRFSKILQQNDLEKAAKSPMNIITGSLQTYLSG